MPTSRRKVLQTIASAAVAAPLAAQHQHGATDGLVQIAKAPAKYTPKYFKPEDFKAVATLVELIIPRTDTPGAVDAGAHRIIDSDVSSRPALQVAWTEGLKWLNNEARQRSGKPFAELPQEQQIAILRSVSDAADTTGGRFFTLVKGATVDAYYNTREGLMMDLGWNANTYLPEFKGCTHKEHQS